MDNSKKLTLFPEPTGAIGLTDVGLPKNIGLPRELRLEKDVISDLSDRPPGSDERPWSWWQRNIAGYKKQCHVEYRPTFNPEDWSRCPEGNDDDTHVCKHDVLDRLAACHGL